MPKEFIWNDKYSVKVSSLDEQHKHFFQITNQIIYLLEEPHSSELKSLLTDEIVELGRYANHHLDYEEKCMHNCRCEGCEGHPEAHDIYRDKVLSYLKQVREESTDIYALAQEVAEFSQQWLSKHILSKDREYIGCLTESGIQ